jgi:hypothetical protein
MAFSVGGLLLGQISVTHVAASLQASVVPLHLSCLGCALVQPLHHAQRNNQPKPLILLALQPSSWCWGSTGEANEAERRQRA